MSTTIKPLATEEGQLALATALNNVTEGVLHITENVTAAANSATAASNSATSASGSATTATNKANEASASATAASKAEIDAENFAVSDVTFTKETGSDHTTTYYSAKHYAESASTDATTATDAATYISAHADQIDQNTGGVSANSKRIGNIEKLLQGNLYDYQTDSTSGYTKSVPAGAMPYAGLELLGGKTVVMNQLVQNGNFDDSSVWSTTSTGTISISSPVLTYTVITPRADAAISGNVLGTIIGHKYYVSVILKYNNSLPGSNPWVGSGGYDGYNGTAVTSINQWKHISGVFDRTTNGGNDNFAIFLRTQNSSVGDTIGIQKCICVDLTLMFGLGNEPTAQQFETMFPSYWYAYNTGSLLLAGVTSVISKDSTNTTLQTYSIPAEIQALEGYGWSAGGTVSNYIDFERKKFVKCVDRVDLGTLTYIYLSDNIMFATNRILARPNTSPMICSKFAYLGVMSDEDFTSVPNLSMASSGANPWIKFKYTDTTDPNVFKSAMSGIYLYYELITPIEIDISAYLTDDNLIQVEAGGTLTFPNSNGTDYQIPVPSEETYMIDLQSALGE